MGSGRRAGSWMTTNNCKWIAHWTHSLVLPCHSWPGPDPCLGPQLGVDVGSASSAGFLCRASSSVSSDWSLSGKAVGGRGEDPGEACPCPAAWPVVHPSPPHGQTDSPQPSPSGTCSHAPWEGKGALRKSLAQHPDPPDSPSSLLSHTLSLHRACCRRLTPHMAQVAPPREMCFPTGLTM